VTSEAVTRMWRARSTGALVLMALVVGGARSQTVETPYTPRAMAENGAVVMMPDIAGLDCSRIANVLRRIDHSNYRGPDPLHVGHPDWLIFEYEDALAKKYYFSCTLAENRLEDPGPTFLRAFESQ
jgi:hypothetical protein